MSKVYKIHSDVEHYMMFTLDDLDILEKIPDFQMQAIGSPLAFNWVAPKAEFIPADNGSEEKPDITKWSTNDLVLTKASFDRLASHLTNKIVEIYPLSGDGEDYLFINPVARVVNEAVDTEKTRVSYFDNGSVNEVETLILKSTATSSLPAIFTLAIDDGVDLYCNESFKNEIEQHKFKGLHFQEVEQS